nr:hypothetical protein [uncultured Albidiferax sp.]
MIKPANFLAMEPVLVTQLKAKLADMLPKIEVLTSVDLNDVTEQTQVTPAIHVVFADSHVAEAREGRLYRFEQTWLAVVVTRNMRSMRSGSDAREDAGLIAMRVLGALGGFQPDIATKPLKFIDGPKSGFRAGFQYLPLAFQVELLLQTH